MARYKQNRFRAQRKQFNALGGEEFPDADVNAADANGCVTTNAWEE